MKKHPHWLWSPLVCLGLCLTFTLLVPGAAAQQQTYRRLNFSTKRHVLSESVRLPGNFYSGEGEVVIAPFNSAVCSLEIESAAVVEKIRFIVRRGGQLRVRGALLRECQISLDPGAEVVLDSCAMDRCEFNADGTQSVEPAKLRIINSIVSSGAWMVPMNSLGLEMMDSVVIGQLSSTGGLRLETGSLDNLDDVARRPNIRYTRFQNCLVHASILLTSSQVTFERCRGSFSGERPPIGTGGTKPMVMMPIRWVDSTPAALPTQIGDGVGVLMVEQPISGGCSLTAKVENGALSMDGLTQTEPKLISLFLPQSVAEGTAPGATMATTSTSSLPSSKELKLKQTHVNGLLVMPLASGKEAGQVTRMNMTALPGSSYLRFNQSVGSDMMTALNEVNKFVLLRHEGMPRGLDLEIAFEEKYSGKDGPSAAVACALLVESMYTGQTWDPAFAVTGDMNADGSVQPIGGVSAKLRGATKGACKIIAIPAKNERAVSDILVMDGPAALAGIHVFSLENFDQAVNLASAQRPATLQQAVDEFDVIRTVLLRDPRQMTAILRSAQAVARLQAILEKAPNSLSAKHLLLYAQGRMPSILSIGGSLEAADSNAIALLASIRNDFKGAVRTLKQDELGGALNRLSNLRPRLDPRVWPYVDALVDYGQIVRTEVLNPARTVAKFNEMAGRANQAGSVANSAKESLLADPEVREDLGL